MSLLARSSSSVLILGGALMTVLLAVMTVAPASPAIYGFFVVAPAIGIGVLGARLVAGGGAGRFGRFSAWIAALGGIMVVFVGGYAIVTNQFSAGVGAGSDDPLAIPFMLTSMAWMLGSLGFALALVRSGTIPALGGWLVLLGTVTAIVLGTLLGSIAPELSPLTALPFGIGWSVVGLQLRGPVSATSA